MKSIDKKVVSPTKSFWRACPPVRRVSPESTSQLHTLTRTLLSAAGYFADRLKAVTAEYLQSAIILLVSAVIVFGGMVFISRADFLKDGDPAPKAQAVKTSSAVQTSASAGTKTLASSGTGSTATYTYDNEGNRITKTENGKTTYYVNKYYEEDSDGTTRKFIWANGVKVATVEGKKGSSAPEKVTYHHPDNLGGSNVSTDSSGTVAEVNDYYPYGKSRLEERTGTYTNSYLYTGKELDRASGLYYYGARYYDPSTGRFTSIDPWSGDITNPQTLNSYSYVTNNPLKYTDPTGEYSEDVHYDLTFYLSNIAGLGYKRSELIAYRDQFMDDNPETKPNSIKNAKQYHFVSRTEAEKRLNEAIDQKSSPAFGDALHTFQDTYSHGGLTPAKHLILDALGKNPDITALDSASISKATIMARNSFFLLRKLNLRVNGSGDLSHDDYLRQSTEIWLRNKDEIVSYLSTKDKKDEKIKSLSDIMKNKDDQK